jgi:hypothetical protein
VLSETQVGSADPIEYLEAATRFSNERVWGTLNVALFIHPRLERDPAVLPAYESALRDLRYGTIAINQWPAVAYGLAGPPWGAYPGATLADIQSGMGWVHNTRMLERIEKCVLRGPLIVSPKPPWFFDHRATASLAKKLCDFELAPSLFKLPSIAFTALRG